MSHQLTFADGEFNSKRRQTRKEIFLSRMEQLLPWPRMLAVIEPIYPKVGNGRRPYPLETMLRIHCLQQWYTLSDGAMEDALYEIASMRLFARLSLDQPIPDRTTIMNFRHLLEQHLLARQLFETINLWLSEAGIMMTQGTLVDATIIEAPSSTKNKREKRDTEMHQTKKGNQWYFGMKAHIGVDSRTKIIHAVVATAANVADSQVLADLLHGEETRVWGDQAYRGLTDVIKAQAPNALDFTNQRYRHRGVVDEAERAKNRTKSKVRSKVEHAFHIIKRLFGFVMVRYRGLDKNAHRLFVTCALANLFVARRHLLRA